jgi:AmiR/NasT family two-component response regulator
MSARVGGILIRHRGHLPRVHPSAYVAPTATLVGDVSVGSGLVVDDQALLRSGFAMILAADGIEVVGEAADGAQAIEAVRRTRPDVVLMDIRMPEMDGLEGHPADHVQRRTPARIIILTTFDLDR